MSCSRSISTNISVAYLSGLVVSEWQDWWLGAGVNNVSKWLAKYVLLSADNIHSLLTCVCHVVEWWSVKCESLYLGLIIFILLVTWVKQLIYRVKWMTFQTCFCGICYFWASLSISISTKLLQEPLKDLAKLSQKVPLKSVQKCMRTHIKKYIDVSSFSNIKDTSS